MRAPIAATCHRWEATTRPRIERCALCRAECLRGTDGRIERYEGQAPGYPAPCINPNAVDP